MANNIKGPFAYKRSVLGDCTYCGEPLTNEMQSVSCDHCGEGYHVACARNADELFVHVESHLFRSNSYRLECPSCEEYWSIGFDPRE